MRKRTGKTGFPALRKKAEKHLASAPEGSKAHLEDPMAMLHKLQVYQIELEMQNEDLRSSRAEADELRQKYQDLYDFAPFGYVTLDAQGDVREVNLKGAELLGVPRSRVGSKRFELFLDLPSRPVFRGFLENIRASDRRQSCDVRLESKQKAGERYLHMEGETVPLPGGGWREIRLAVIDITDRIRAEEALKRSHEDLERRVDERTRELSLTVDALQKEIAAREKVEQALREEMAAGLRAADEVREKDRMLMQQGRLAAMGEMLGNIAHQWRQPLNNLGLMIQQLPLWYGTDQFTRDYLESTVEKSSELIFHMSRTIDDFRNFFRPDKKQVVFRPRQVVEKTLSLIQDGLATEGIVITTDWDCDPEVLGHPNEFSQALLNILLNARDALVERKVPEPRIMMRLCEERGKTVVFISDNAGGIPIRILDSIFDPYFTTKTPDKGTGMGLFMSKAIIEKNMAGSLTAGNKAEGAEFRIEI